MELNGIKINFLGDSITEGHGVSDNDHRFTNIIEKTTGAICRNYGIGGTRFARQNDEENRDDDYCSRFSKMDDDADIVAVFGGTNDFGHGNAPLGEFKDRTPDTFYGACHFLFSGLITKYPTAKIVVFTPLHRCNEDDPRGDGRYPFDFGTLKDYVNIIREIAEYYSLPVLDLFAESGLQPCVPVIREKYIPDGLHPNDAGHIILAEKIISFFKTL